MGMQYPIWKEEEIPDLINDDEDFALLKERNYETLLDYDGDEPQSLQQQACIREEAAIANINFETFLIRQQLEEEEEKMQDYMEEMKSSRPAQYADQYDSD